MAGFSSRSRGAPAPSLWSGWAILLVAGSVIAAGVIAFIAWSNSEYTNCFGMFASSEAAERAAEAADDAGFDASVERPEPKTKRYPVTFESGETGHDAAGFRETFARILREEGGEPGHPGGCLERGPIN